MINCVFIQVLMFTSDGAVKQNMQTVSLPYHSGGSDNKKHITVIFHLCSSANDLICFCVSDYSKVTSTYSAFHPFTSCSRPLLGCKFRSSMCLLCKSTSVWNRATKQRHVVCFTFLLPRSIDIITTMVRIQYIYNELWVAVWNKYCSLMRLRAVMLMYLCIMKQYFDQVNRWA